MKRISRILFLIAAITSVVNAFCTFVSGVSILATCSLIVNAMYYGGAFEGTDPQVAMGLAYGFIIAAGVILILCIIPNIILAIFGFKGAKGKINKGVNIACIALGAIFGCKLFIPAGILGFISDKKADKKEE